jgi:hypothetical protein
MAVLVLTDCVAWIDSHDFTTDLNTVNVDASVDDQETTTFGGSGYKTRIGGLRNVESALKGNWQSAASDAVDPNAFADLGVVDRVATFAPTSTAGSVAYFYQAANLTYNVFGGVGDLAPFDLKLTGSSYAGLVRGQVAKAKGTVSATGVLGSAVQLGAVSSSQYVYCAFHIFGTPGTTITARIESDNASNFPSAATVATFGPLTTAGGTWVTRTIGPITDDWFRLNVTAITGTFTVAAAIAVQ